MAAPLEFFFDYSSPYSYIAANRIVDGEPFWGADRLDMIDRWLARGGW